MAAGAPTLTDKKAFTSAMAILPTYLAREEYPELHDLVQNVRRSHDKAFQRWPPHINLLYPFLDYTNSTPVITPAEASEKIAQVCRSFEPFWISFSKLGVFNHSRGAATVFLEPHAHVEDGGDDTGEGTNPLNSLQAALEAAFPICNDLGVKGKKNGFQGHMTTASIAASSKRTSNDASPQLSGEEMAKKLGGTLFPNGEWKVQVDRIHWLVRDATSPFRIHKEFRLGSAGGEAITPTIDLEGKVSLKAKTTSTQTSTAESTKLLCFQYQPSEGKYVQVSPVGDQSESFLSVDDDGIRLITYNVLYDSRLHAEQRWPLVANALRDALSLSHTSTSDAHTGTDRPVFIALQECTKDCLDYLLNQKWVRDRFYTSHPNPSSFSAPRPSPTPTSGDHTTIESTSDAVSSFVLPEKGGLVLLSTVPFQSVVVPFSQHKVALVSQVTLRCQSSAETTTLPTTLRVRLANIHLTSDLRGDASARRAQQAQILCDHLELEKDGESENAAKLDIALGDLNAGHGDKSENVFLGAGFEDAWIQHQQQQHATHVSGGVDEDEVLYEQHGFTYDPVTNSLARLNAAKDPNVGRRYDRILVRYQQLHRVAPSAPPHPPRNMADAPVLVPTWTIENVRLFGKEPTWIEGLESPGNSMKRDGKEGYLLFPSDHYGICCDLRISDTEGLEIAGLSSAMEKTDQTSNSKASPSHRETQQRPTPTTSVDSRDRLSHILVAGSDSGTGPTEADTLERILVPDDFSLIPHDSQIHQRAIISVHRWLSKLFEIPSSSSVDEDTSSESASPTNTTTPTPSTSSRKSLPFDLKPVGSYALNLHTPDSDLDLLCASFVRKQRFFALVNGVGEDGTELEKTGRNEGEGSDVKVVRVLGGASIPIVELVVGGVGGVRVDLQYCWIPMSMEQAVTFDMDNIPAEVLYSIPAASASVLSSRLNIFPIIKAVTGFNITTTSPPTSVTFPTEEVEHVSDTEPHQQPTSASLSTALSHPRYKAFELAYRAIKSWASQRGVMGQKMGYLGGHALCLMVARCARIVREDEQSQLQESQSDAPSDIHTNADVQTNTVQQAWTRKIIRTFFQTYAEWDFERTAVSLFSPPITSNTFTSTISTSTTTASTSLNLDEPAYGSVMTVWSVTQMTTREFAPVNATR
ncbi:hypothetical protein HK102_004612, partial [Quaeritorhiza haematococci]